MNNKITAYIACIAIIFSVWLFFPNFDGKDAIRGYSISKDVGCKEKCKIKALTPTFYVINNYNKEVNLHAPELSIIRTYENCSIISVKDWECKKYNGIDYGLHRKLKMSNGIIIEEILIPYTMVVKYVPKWKWKLVKYFGWQPELD